MPRAGAGRGHRDCRRRGGDERESGWRASAAGFVPERRTVRAWIASAADQAREEDAFLDVRIEGADNPQLPRRDARGRRVAALGELPEAPLGLGQLAGICWIEPVAA